MIELVPTEHDDLAFLTLVRRIISGAIATLEIRDVFLVLRAVQNGGAGKESRRFNLAAHMSAVL